MLAVVFAASVFGAHGAFGQEFKWGFRFDTRFDNREFDDIKRDGIVTSKTYFSTRLAPVIGIGLGNHNIMGGGSFTFDMGAPFDSRDPELLLYYNYNSPNFKAYAGKFERRRLIGSYSRAIYSGSTTFYDNVIEGFALQYTPQKSKLELVLDWDGMQAAGVRESFRVMSSGEWNPVEIDPVRWLTAGYCLNVYHLASSANATEGVFEHILVNPYVGVAFERLADWFEKLTLHVGWMNSFDRERRGENVWKTPGGVTVDFTVQKWKAGIRNRLYVGDKQMPFWNTRGNDGKRLYSSVYRGDPLYSVTGTYNFTQIYWKPQLAKGIVLELECGIHYDGSSVGWQQVAWIGVSLDSGMFDRKNKGRRE